MKRVSRVAALILAGCMVAGSLAACGSSDSSSSSSSENAAATAAADSGGSVTTETEAAEAVGADVEAGTELSDKTIRVGYNYNLDSLDCFRSNTGRDAIFLQNLFENLAVLNSETHEMEPWCAKSWTTDDNGYTYDIEIYDYINDSAGNHITADDIVWYIETSKEKGLMPNFAKVESVTKTGDYTLQVKMTDNIVGAFETLLTDVHPISQAAYEASPDQFATECITTSAYVVSDFVPGNSIDFTRRDDYWQTDIELLPECVRPICKEVDYYFITEASQEGIAVETDTIDVYVNMDSTTAIQYVDNPDYIIDLSDGPQGWELFFSGAENRVVYDNVPLCQAICYAIDEEGLVTALCDGYGTVMWDVCPPGSVGFLDKWMDEDYYNYDPEKAKELVAESGYNGETLTLLTSSSTFNQRLAQMIQNYLLAVGINCELNVGDSAYITATRLDGTQYDMFINSIGAVFLTDHWAIRYDPAAYETGDATSRHDYELADLLYKTWTVDGYTEENIDEVHSYIRDNAIAYGMLNPYVFTVWRSDCGLVKQVKGGLSGYVLPSACQFE